MRIGVQDLSYCCHQFVISRAAMHRRSQIFYRMLFQITMTRHRKHIQRDRIHHLPKVLVCGNALCQRILPVQSPPIVCLSARMHCICAVLVLQQTVDNVVLATFCFGCSLVLNAFGSEVKFLWIRALRNEKFTLGKNM